MWEDRLRIESQLLRRKGGVRQLVPLEEESGPYVRIENRRLLDFANWDVFGLTSRRDFRKSLHEFADRGAGRLSLSRGGWTRYHRAAESSLAAFLGCEDALLLSSRNQAIFSFVLNTLTDQDILFVDEDLGVTPVLDAAVVGAVPVVPYTSTTTDQVVRKLGLSGVGERLVWIQGFNLELGLLAKLGDTERMVRGTGVRIVVDESFTIGLMGPQLGGLVDFCGLRGVPAAIVGGLGPALGVSGGIIAGSSHLCELIRLRSPAVHKEASLSVGTAASIPTALEILRGVSGEVERVRALCRSLKEGLIELGLEVRTDGGLPIISVALPAGVNGYRIWESLVAAGFWADFDESVLRSVRTSLLRFIVSIRHESEHIKRVIETMGGVARGLNHSSSGGS